MSSASRTYDWITAVSRLYERQALYESNQADLVSRITDVTEYFGDDPSRIAEGLLRRVEVVNRMEATLLEEYESIAGRMGIPDAQGRF